MAELQLPLIVLDYDGVIRTWRRSHLKYLENLVATYIQPASQILQNSGFDLKTLELEQIGHETVKQILRHAERREFLYAINGILVGCECPKEARQAAQSSINTLLDQNLFPPLPEPDIDVNSVRALKNLGYRVSLLTIQGRNFSLPEALENVFEQVMIVPPVEDRRDTVKIRAYGDTYPDTPPYCYVGDQSYEADVAQGIRATYFFQVTGELPRYELERIRADTATVGTLADFVGQLNTLGLGRNLENA